MYVCGVCVCVKEREIKTGREGRRERERATKRGKEREREKENPMDRDS